MNLVPDVVINLPPQFYRCEPSWSWNPPPLNDHDFWFVLEGHGVMHWREQSFILQSGACFVIPPGTVPRAIHDPKRRLSVFAVHFSFCEDFEISSHIRQGEVVRERALLESLAARCQRNFHRENGRDASQATLREMIQILCDEARYPASPLDSAIEKIVTAIRAEPGANWNVEKISKEAHLSPSQFTRRFRQMTHMPPAHFVIHTRLQRACELLRETQMSLLQISDALGYNDVTFFARQFKKHLGCTPGEMRKTKSSKR